MNDEQVTEVLRRHRDELLGVPGVAGLAVGNARAHGGADEPCLVVFVKPGADEDALPRSLEGVRVYLEKTPGFGPQGLA